jgi:hypothetical protein
MPSLMNIHQLVQKLFEVGGNTRGNNDAMSQPLLIKEREVGQKVKDAPQEQADVANTKSRSHDFRTR